MKYLIVLLLSLQLIACNNDDEKIGVADAINTYSDRLTADIEDDDDSITSLYDYFKKYGKDYDTEIKVPEPYEYVTKDWSTIYDQDYLDRVKYNMTSDTEGFKCQMELSDGVIESIFYYLEDDLALNIFNLDNGVKLLIKNTAFYVGENRTSFVSGTSFTPDPIESLAVTTYRRKNFYGSDTSIIIDHLTEENKFMILKAKSSEINPIQDIIAIISNCEKDSKRVFD